MDEQLARILIGYAVRAARDIGNLAPMLNEHSDRAIYDEMKPGIGSVVYDIYETILGPMFRRFPHLKAEFEQNIERYGSGW
jgi:hypothetical protein